MILIVYREKQLKNIVKCLKTSFYIAVRIIGAENFKLRRNNRMGYYIIKKLDFFNNSFLNLNLTEIELKIFFLLYNNELDEFLCGNL